jgi:hypothetical protein
MANASLRSLCDILLSGLDPQDRNQLEHDALGAFSAWRAQAVKAERGVLRPGQTAQGQEFFSEVDLILPFLRSASTSSPSLADQPWAHIAAVLLLELPQKSLAHETALTAMLVDEIARQKTDQALTRQAARVAPLREEVQRLDEGRRRGGAAPKGIPELDTYLRQELARNREATAKELWRGIKDAKEVRIEDAQIWIEDDQLWVDRNGRRKSIKFPSFERYVTLARKQKSQ